MSELKIIVLNGYAGSGKDTFYKFCEKYIHKEHNYEPVIISHTSMVELAKYIAKLTGWDETKTEENRKYLSDIKDLIDNYNNASMNYIEQHIALINYKYNSYDRYIFIDARQPEDIEYLVNEYNAITVFITNDNIDKVISNHADANVDKYKYDYYIDNNGTLDELDDRAKNFMLSIANNVDIITIEEDELNESVY